MSDMQKEILRSQYDGKKQLWRIAKKTNNGAGGWKSFGSGSVYETIDQANDKIEFLIQSYPDQYQKE